MIHSNWKKLFSPHILRRGKEYYNDGRVSQFSWQGNRLTADVDGSERYQVTVSFDATKKIVESYSCDCPFGEDGTPCKHLAAVLYSIEYGDTKTDNSCTEAHSLEETVAKLSEKQIRELLIQLAQKDSHVWEKIQLLSEKQLSASQKGQWAFDLQRITESARNRYDYIDYNDAYDYCYELTEYLDARVPDLIAFDALEDAFELTIAVFQEATEQHMDDSDGGLTIIAGCCTHYWTEIMECSDLKLHKKMLHWFRDHYYDSDIGEMFLEEYIFDAPWDTALAEEILLLINSLLEQTENPYTYENLVRQKLHWMKLSNADDAEIENYIKEYDYLPEIRQMLITQALNKRDYDTALTLLNESKNRDRNLPGLIAKYSEQIIGIYETTGDTTHLREELEYYIFNCTQHDLQHIEKMKTLLSQTEWEEMRSRLLNSSSMSWQRFSLMEREGMYEEMMVRIEAKADLYTLERYEYLLKEHFPQRCINVYVLNLQRAMGVAYDRNAYQKLTHTMKKLLKYPNGKSAAQQLADTWKLEYPRRKALLDELKKAGF